jgi:hypothetical protein
LKTRWAALKRSRRVTITFGMLIGPRGETKKLRRHTERRRRSGTAGTKRVFEALSNV